MTIGARRPFVDRPVADIAAATEAAVDAARQWDLTIWPTPLRVGMNVLYAGRDVVVRVGHTTAPAASAFDLHRVLSAAGVPVPTPVVGATADIGDYGLTAWKRIKQVRRPANMAAVGAAIRVVHSLPGEIIPEGYPMPSPRRFPWWDLPTMIEEAAPLLDGRSCQGLQRCIDTNFSHLGDVDTEQVVCHGDLHRANIVSSAVGPVLLDWDLLCWSHRAWDHAVLLSMVHRWGEPAATYDAFASGYGESLADDDLTCALASLRDVAATLLLAQAVAVGRGNTVELERRLAFWRGDTPTAVFSAQ